MLNWVLAKTIGTHNERMLRRFTPMVQKITYFEPTLEKLTDEELKAMLRARYADLLSGKDPGISFEDVFGEKA